MLEYDECCKHDFEPRYDKRYTTPFEEALKSIESLSEATLPLRCANPYLKEQIYVYDICVKCGKIIKRE